MDKLSKITSILLYVTIITGLIFIIAFRFMGSELPVSLGYVYSESMEPTIMTNDGYFLIHSKNYEVGDIITFKPKFLKEPYVTHRIVDVMEDHTFITKGDNNPSLDQEVGEPPVNHKQIQGKVFTINGTPLIIPRLGTISEKFNIFTLIAIVVGLYAVDFLFKSFSKKPKHYKRKNAKRLRLIHISSFFDPVFIAFCAIIILNSIFIGLTVKSSNTDQIPFIVVSTKGLSSPTPGEEFTRELSLENKTWLPFVVFLEPKSKGTVVNPPKLSFSSNQYYDYTATIVAPGEVGAYTETIHKVAYPNILPVKWIDYMYSKHKLLPLSIIFMPGVLLNIGLYIWWSKRTQLGRRKVYGWLIPFRKYIRNW
ncbi:signal peptidase I [Lederbergia panacisoli]|uniref:signal peptidase I n=1 Tax=Lederbergia panacisoli TaxID=1255251 RepID=UPI00214AAF84|nr:signal peptidase I [Lederbergia panacisoli]MCR2823280.1 signal peptidase I [Lederbergia panacisoli]